MPLSIESKLILKAIAPCPGITTHDGEQEKPHIMCTVQL